MHQNAFSSALCLHLLTRFFALVTRVTLVLGLVAGLKNGELVMASVVGGDCRDKMADRSPGSYR